MISELVSIHFQDPVHEKQQSSVREKKTLQNLNR